MDEATVRRHLEEVRIQLARNEREHDVLLQLLHGYEGWLQLGGINGYGSTAPVQHSLMPGKQSTPVGTPYVPKGPQPKGTISFRKALTQVLDEAHGAPLHSKEIATRVIALGVGTTAKDVPAVVDLMCKSVPGAEKVGPRTWRKVPTAA